MVEKITAAFIIQIAGKPVENVEKALKLVLEKIKESKDFKLLESHIGQPELEEESTLYSGFLEITIKFDDIRKLFDFMLDYTPTSIEIEDPQKLEFDASALTAILNDMGNMILKSFSQVRNLNAHIHMLNAKIKELEK